MYSNCLPVRLAPCVAIVPVITMDYLGYNGLFLCLIFYNYMHSDTRNADSNGILASLMCRVPVQVRAISPRAVRTIQSYIRLR